MSPHFSGSDRDTSETMLFPEDDDGDVSMNSSPRSAGSSARRRLGNSVQTPLVDRGTRRLFDDDDNSEDEGLLASPPRRLTTAEYASAAPASSSRQPSSNRKRSSLHHSHSDPFPSRMESGLNTSDSDQTMSCASSPRISPASYRTMDGRFVQSKNPFSSPMVTEDTTVQQINKESAPAFPMSFPADAACGTHKPSSSFLPPRHNHHHGLMTAYNNKREEEATPLPAPNQTPAPAQYLSAAAAAPSVLYTKYNCSPIPENQHAMETDEATTMSYSTSASSGSLQKVRRLHRSDDVFSSSKHQWSAQHQQQLQAPPRLSIHTTTDDDAEREISPTEVIKFPPPTPVKAKPSKSPYQSIRRSEGPPPTPLPPSRRLAARTPHPGSLVHEPTVQNKSRFTSDFDVIDELGRGSFGTVYKVLSRLDGCMYAIKAAQRQAKGAADRDRMLQEVYALAALSDQANTATFHIVRYHQAWMEDDHLYIQTEVCTGTLSDEIVKHGHTLPEPRRYKLLREITLALEFIHQNSMVHLDIKPDNIFLKNDQFKLGDFGLVARLSSDNDVEEGDSRYMSMELLSGDHTDLTKSDIFSLGITMYEILLCRPLPMNGPEWQDIRAGTLAPMPHTDMTSIVTQMMHPQAASRPTASQLLQHRELLSEQKRLMAEMTKVKQANMELAAKVQMIQPVKRGLQRANTWNGSSMPYL